MAALLPFADSKIHQEHEDVRLFFEGHPEYVGPMNAVLAKYGSVHFPCEDAENTTYLRTVVSHFIKHPNPDFDDLAPFYVLDLGRVVVQMAKFRKNLPGVQPFFAVKCNPCEQLLAMISALGGSFDCASQAEFTTVLRGGYSDAAEGIIFANPCKSVADLKCAERSGIRYVTFDNIKELEKLATHFPSAKAVLRIKTDDSAAVCQFSTKFGASMTEVPSLLERAVELGVRLVGVSFHVGSGNNDPNAYMRAILNARSVFDQATHRGFDMKLLDLGGGFPGTEPAKDEAGKPQSMSFEEICAQIRPLLEEFFQGTKIIAEPGRYFSASTHALAMNVHSMRTVPMPNGGMEYQYYVNDGLYHSFNSIVYDHAHPELHLVKPDCESSVHCTTIFGPTCDSLDCILKRTPFPELEIGDWLFVPDMGSYTTAAAVAFNGYATRRFETICSLPLGY